MAATVTLGEVLDAGDVDVGGALGVQLRAHLVRQPREEAAAQRPRRVAAPERGRPADTAGAVAQQRGGPVVGVHQRAAGTAGWLVPVCLRVSE